MCAIVTGGGLKCWGFNYYGQLGIGNTMQKDRPVDVDLGSGVLCLLYWTNDYLRAPSASAICCSESSCITGHLLSFIRSPDM